MPVFAVDRHEVSGLDQTDHQFQFFLRGVPANVDAGNATEEHFGALTVEVVDRAIDEQFVSGDRGRGSDDGVARLDLDVRLVAVRLAHQTAALVTLAAWPLSRELFAP